MIVTESTPVSQSPVVPNPISTSPVNNEIEKPKKKGFKILALIVFPLIILILIVLLLTKTKKSNLGTSGEITWWGLWEDQSSVMSLITEYESKNPKVKIKYIKQSQQDYRERLTNALAKGTGPDIFTFHNSWVPMFKNYLDAIPSSIMTPVEFTEIYYPVVVSDLTYSTGILGIPLGFDALTLFINTDIFEKYGKNPPTTWDDLRSLAIEMTQKNELGVITQSGVSLGSVENVDHWQEILALLMLQNGVDLKNPTGKLAEDALTYFTLFSKSDGVWDSSLPASTSMFAGGKLAMYLAPSWRVFEIKKLNPSVKFKTVPVPQLVKGSSSQKDITYATYWIQGVSNKSLNKSTSWNFLKYISSKESLSKIFSNASSQRDFGEPYPRIDMADLLSDHPILGSIISKASSAESWYLVSRTFDGPTGINSLIGKYFEDAVSAVNLGDTAEKVLPTVAQGITQVLKQYGVK